MSIFFCAIFPVRREGPLRDVAWTLEATSAEARTSDLKEQHICSVSTLDITAFVSTLYAQHLSAFVTVLCTLCSLFVALSGVKTLQRQGVQLGQKVLYSCVAGLAKNSKFAMPSLLSLSALLWT